jgi:DNA primase
MTLLELTRQAGLNPKWVASTGGDEYHSACPSCGGTDRFYIQPNKQMAKCLGVYCCRQCGIHGDTIQFARQFLNYSFQEAAQIAGANITERSILTYPASAYASRLVTLKSPSKEWIIRATDFVDQAHKCLLYKQDILEYLAHRGLPLDAVERYKLGWSDNDQFFSRVSWGLTELLGPAGKPRALWIPRGLVIPVSEQDGKVIRLKVRRCDWHEGDELPKYVAISGSMNGLSIIGSTACTTMVVVESELDAYAVDFAAHDLVCTIAVGSNIKNPDNVTDRLARSVKHLIICHDNDGAGIKMLNKWQRLYPHAIGYPTPIGKDIGEAIQNGFNVREWLLRAGQL